MTLATTMVAVGDKITFKEPLVTQRTTPQFPWAGNDGSVSQATTNQERRSLERTQQAKDNDEDD